MKSIISKILQKAAQNSFNLKLTIQEIEEKIEIPPDSLMGDFAFPCFFLSSKLRKNPNEIAIKIKNEIKNIPKDISEIKVSGPYLNFFVDKKILAVNLIKRVLKEKEKYGNSNEGKGKTIVIDMSSPNIAKPFGIGHLRSTIIGNSISNIAKSQEYKTIKINYLGDWGTQFGKIIVGYKKIGNDKELKKDSAKYMLKWYIEGNKKEYEEDARKWFKKLEDGDKETLKLWKMFKDLSIKDFEKIYKILGVKFDVISGESFYNNKMDKTIKELKLKKLLEQSEGALVVNLDKYNLGVCLIQKTDGATLYATRDLTAAIERYDKYKFSKIIYEVGQEQKLHFQQVFKVLELMGYKFSKECVHTSHGLYLDEDGKKFATRKGKTIFMEDILNETIEIAKKKIQEKNTDLKNKNKIARKIAIAAIFYGDLKNQRTNDIVFNIERFLDFDGNTGPYLQYSYARASSILRKAGKNTKKSKALNEKEIALIKKINDFPEVVKKSYEHLFPNLIANYSFELAQKFNEFYHSCPVIGSENEQFRLKLVEAFRITIKKSLYLLGIEVMEEM
ncbi:MAG TPA: arginine--tRNA ligase [Candidatus Nanoarchaeia archaeon]|nr:arginine--tRNA ligase [Candidatus Nanoarchaeia archaeon]